MGLWGGAKGRSETPRRHGPHILKETRLKEIRQTSGLGLWSNLFNRQQNTWKKTMQTLTGQQQKSNSPLEYTSDSDRTNQN